jgi:hypothetical protein
MSKDLTSTFTIDELGDMISAATYLLSTQPSENDPRASAHRASLHGLNAARVALLSDAKRSTEKVVEPRLTTL